MPPPFTAIAARFVAYPKGRYSADYFTERLIGFLKEG
jgi:hypothetical protein